MVDVSLKKKAHDLLQKGKLDSALRVFEAILKEDPEDASVFNSAGDVLLKLKRKDEALSYFTKASELYLKDSLHMVALSVSRKALRAEPEYGMAHYVMAVCFEEQAKPDQARREYILFLKSKPGKGEELVLNTLTALTRLDPEDRNWVIRLARTAFVQKKLGVLDRCVSLAAERGFPEHQKMIRMLEELRLDINRAQGRPETPAMRPAAVRRPPEPLPEEEEEHYPGGEETTPEEPAPDDGEAGPEEPSDGGGYAEEEQYSDEDYAGEEYPPEEQYAPAEIGVEPDEEYGRDEAEAPGEEAGEPDGEPAGEPQAVENPLQQLAFDEGDFAEAEAVEKQQARAADEPADEDEDEDAGEDSRPRKRLGEYFVADGLLKASDVLKALEFQASAREYHRLGDVLVEMALVSVRQVREALSKQVADMRHRLEKSPGDALGWVELGNLLLDVSDFYGAVEAYLKAAEIYRATGREKMVFELLEGVLDICPESLAAARELVRIRNSLGPQGQARSLYRLAVAFLLNDSPHEAVAALEASTKADPTFTMALTLLEGVKPGLADMDNYADIASILADIDRLFDADSARALAGLVKEFQDGIKDAVQANDYNTHYDLGIAYREMGLLREAVAEFNQVLPSPEHRIKAREMLGRCFLDMGRFDEAEEQFQKGLTLAGKDSTSLVGFHLNLARVYEATGRKRQSEAERSAACRIDPVLATIQDSLE